LKIEVVYAPKTGNIKPWELYGVFTFPHPMRKHWASFKTEAAAKRRATVLRKKYPQAAEAVIEVQSTMVESQARVAKIREAV
jgi:hypothetical protein